MKPHEQMNSLPDEATYIIEGLVMEGSLNGGEHPVVIEGHFKGEINAVNVVVRQQGTVDGTIKAEIASICGNFKGNLVCENLIVTESGVVEGDLKANNLSIDLGAEIIGSISRIT
ncbi:polymer-forming cytoskeletal protein [Candidatus Puniceispirillum sp.]|nr:polymer-forming cytoskeletal protein [Candidatus Puniceispirillum sp.]